jgi:hypothetical protein
MESLPFLVLLTGTGMKTRTVRWTPHPGQQGKTHIAGFVALILTDDFQGVRCPLYMRRIHIQIDVKSYETKWLLPAINLNGMHAHPIAKPSSNVNSGQAGPDIVYSVTAGEEIAGLDLKCKSNVYNGYEPSIKLVNVSINGNATAGHCTEASCSSATELAGWGGFGEITVLTSGPGISTAEGERVKQFEFAYTSVTGMDEVLSMLCSASRCQGRRHLFLLLGQTADG